MFASPSLSTQPPFPAWIPYHFLFIRPLLFLFLFPSILYFRFHWIKTLPSFFRLLSSFSPIRLFSLKTGSFVSASFPSYLHNTKFPEDRPFRLPSTSASFFSVSSFLPFLFFHSSTFASFSSPSPYYWTSASFLLSLCSCTSSILLHLLSLLEFLLQSLLCHFSSFCLSSKDNSVFRLHFFLSGVFLLVFLFRADFIPLCYRRPSPP